MTRPERTALSLLACLVGSWVAARVAFAVGWRAVSAVLVARERARDAAYRRSLNLAGGSS